MLITLISRWCVPVGILDKLVEKKKKNLKILAPTTLRLDI